MSADELLDVALHLPEKERLVLATRLLESVPDDYEGLQDDDPDLNEELERRYKDFTGGVRAEDLWND